MKRSCHKKFAGEFVLLLSYNSFITNSYMQHIIILPERERIPWTCCLVCWCDVRRQVRTGGGATACITSAATSGLRGWLPPDTDIMRRQRRHSAVSGVTHQQCRALSCWSCRLTTVHLLTTSTTLSKCFDCAVLVCQLKIYSKDTCYCYIIFQPSEEVSMCEFCNGFIRYVGVSF